VAQSRKSVDEMDPKPIANISVPAARAFAAAAWALAPVFVAPSETTIMTFMLPGLLPASCA